MELGTLVLRKRPVDFQALGRSQQVTERSQRKLVWVNRQKDRCQKLELQVCWIWGCIMTKALGFGHLIYEPLAIRGDEKRVPR